MHGLTSIIIFDKDPSGNYYVHQPQLQQYSYQQQHSVSINPYATVSSSSQLPYAQQQHLAYPPPPAQAHTSLYPQQQATNPPPPWATVSSSLSPSAPSTNNAYAVVPSTPQQPQAYSVPPQAYSPHTAHTYTTAPLAYQQPYMSAPQSYASPVATQPPTHAAATPHYQQFYTSQPLPLVHGTQQQATPLVYDSCLSFWKNYR